MSAPKLVIRSHAPVRKILFWVLAAVAIMWAGFGLYVAGQSRAGFNRIQTDREIAALRNELVGQRAENLALREKIALLDTAAKIDSEAYRRVEAGLVDLQSKILDQQEDIAFYRGDCLSGRYRGPSNSELQPVPGYWPTDIQYAAGPCPGLPQ
jgi:cell division protein FtsB